MSIPTRDRVIDLDVTRAIALIGVAAMNYRGYLIFLGDSVGDSMINRIFNPWTGPLSTRFAATFVLIAGMGITLLTNRGRLSGDRQRRSADRWTLVRRGMLLYAFGFVFEWVWNGTILFFYGAFFMVGALLFTLRTGWLALIGAAAALTAAGIQWWAFEADHDTTWLLGDWYQPGSYRSPRRLLFDTFVNGTHPLLPWLAFLCAGMILGRHLPLALPTRRLLAALGVVLVAGTYLLNHLFADTPLRSQLLATDPFSRSLNYTICALGSAITAFCVIGWIAERTPDSAVTRAFAAAGRTTLTLYLLHALVFNALVNRWHVIKPAGLDVALAFAAGFWVVAIVAAALWQRRFGIGPAEWIYRKFGGGSMPQSTADVPAAPPASAFTSPR
ncbi:MAG TPA: DUF418 domain-containing protein [Ilumatobacteraceae bacterium]|nr:DUF418 domain-containing protein [Ilumatobacteraceae bacterium]